MKKIYLTTLIWFFVTFGMALAQNLTVRQISENIFEMNYENHVVDGNTKTINFNRFISQLGCNQVSMVDTGMVLPIISQLINVASSHASIEIKQAEYNPIHIKKGSIIASIESAIRKTNINPVQFKYLGITGKKRMGSVLLLPYKINGGKVAYLKQFKARLIFKSTTEPSYSVFKQTESKKDKVAQKIVESGNKTAAYYGHAVRIITKQEGIYKITYQDFENNNLYPQQIDLNSIKLLNKGQQVPIFVSDDDGKFERGDYIEFWAEELKNPDYDPNKTNLYQYPFSSENVYFLVWGEGNGLRMIEESAAVTENNPQNYNPAFYFRDKIHWEENKYFDRLGYFAVDQLSHKYDNWFVDQGVQAVGRKSYSIPLQYPDSSAFNPIDVKVMLQGRSQNRHHAMVWLNDNLIQEIDQEDQWVSQNYYLAKSTSDIPVYSSHLKDGENNLDIQLLLPYQSGSTDIVSLNWVEIEYDRQYKAKNNYLEFRKPALVYFPNNPLYQFTLFNFTDPEIQIYKKGVSKLVAYQVIPVQTDKGLTYKVIFQDNIRSEDVEYIALNESHKLKPDRIEFMQPLEPESVNANLLSPSNRADYLMITNSEFYSDAKKLKELMASTGVEPQLIDVQNIYDQFNDGIKSPLAIKEFFRYVYNHWDQSKPLKYVLLLGDATYDHRGNLSSRDIVPTIFYQTYKFGSVPTDFEYTLLNGDDLMPDIAVGRVPISLNSELLQYIDKVETFLQSEPGEWLNKSLFISGNDRNTREYNNPDLPAFRSQNQRVIDLSMPESFTTYKLNTVKNDTLDFDPNFGSTTDLINYFDEGLMFVDFMGHGGGGIWADVSLMNISDVDLLSNNGKFPFISSLTCFTGAMENPSRYSLGEKMLLEADKGCIAFFGSSGLGWLHNDFAMGWKLPEYLLEEGLRFGDAVNLTKIYYNATADYIGHDTILYTPGYSALRNIMMHQYNLIGDPALRFSLPEKTVHIEFENSDIYADDTLLVSVFAPGISGQGYYEVADYQNQPRVQLPFFYSGDTVHFKIPLPDGIPEGEACFRAFISDGDKAVTGFKKFAINSPYVLSISSVPENPLPGESMQIVVRTNSTTSLDSMRLNWLYVNNSVNVAFHQSEPELYISDPVQLRTDELEYVYSLYLYMTDGKLKKYLNNKFVVNDFRPDFVVDASTVDIVPRSDQATLNIPIFNQGYIDTVTVRARLEQKKSEQWQTELDTTLLFPKKDSLVISKAIQNISNYIGAKLRISVNAVNISDATPSSNQDSIIFQSNLRYVTNGVGMSADQITPDTVKIGNFAELFARSKNLLNNGFVSIEERDIKSLEDNLDQVVPVRLLDQTQHTGVLIQSYFYQPDSVLSVRFYYDKTYLQQQGMAQKSLKIYIYNSRINQWVGENTTIDSIKGFVTTPVIGDGIYAVMSNNDHTPPVIEFTVDGRPLVTKSIVSEKPNISVFVEDNAGVQVDRNLVRILLNGNEIPANAVFIPDSLQNPGYLGIKLFPSLDPGEHDLTVQVRDVNQNMSERTVSLLVATEFDIHVFGNYPNPFSNQTIFSFYIQNNELIDDLEIRIFTVSGKLIRTLRDDINTINFPGGVKNVGYNELIWDGKDKDGYDVANGVYFAMIRAKFQGKVKEKILKVARIR